MELYLIVIIIIVILFVWHKYKGKKTKKKKEKVEEPEENYEKIYKELHPGFIDGMTLDEFKELDDDDAKYLALKQLYVQAELQDLPPDSVKVEHYEDVLKDI